MWKHARRLPLLWNDGDKGRQERNYPTPALHRHNYCTTLITTSSKRHTCTALRLRDNENSRSKKAIARVAQWVLNYPNPNYPYPDIWTLAHITMFSVPAGKRRCGHWSFATGESKAAVRMTLPNATTFFPCSTGFRSQFTTSELAERSREHCGTLYYCIAN